MASYLVGELEGITQYNMQDGKNGILNYCDEMKAVKDKNPDWSPLKVLGWVKSGQGIQSCLHGSFSQQKGNYYYFTQSLVVFLFRD